jgi:hypothetical protein
LLFQPAAIRGCPVLLLLAMLIWALVAITSFPPGAISIQTEMSTVNSLTTVPTFNASFVSIDFFPMVFLSAISVIPFL